MARRKIFDVHSPLGDPSVPLSAAQRTIIDAMARLMVGSSLVMVALREVMQELEKFRRDHQ